MTAYEWKSERRVQWEWKKSGVRVKDGWSEGERRVEWERKKSGVTVKEEWSDRERRVEWEWKKCGVRVKEEWNESKRSVELEWKKNGMRVKEVWSENERRVEWEQKKGGVRVKEEWSKSGLWVEKWSGVKWDVEVSTLGEVLTPVRHRYAVMEIHLGCVYNHLCYIRRLLYAIRVRKVWHSITYCSIIDRLSHPFANFDNEGQGCRE